LSRGPRGCFRSECCTGGESVVVAPPVNRSLALTHESRAPGWTGRKYRFSDLRYDSSPTCQFWWRVLNHCVT